MTRNPRPYNGLHLPHNSLHVPPGHVPQFGSGSREEQVKRAITMEMQALTREIYVRTAAAWLATPDSGGPPSVDDFQLLADQCKTAARQFFIGLGVIEETEETPGE